MKPRKRPMLDKLSLRIGSDLLDKIYKRAAQERRSDADMIRELLRRGLDKSLESEFDLRKLEGMLK